MSDESDTDATTKSSLVLVKELLHATGLIKKKKRKREFLPDLSIIRNDKADQVEPGDATWYEYISAVLKMIEDPALPPSWIPCNRKPLDITDMYV